jgi:hypothetical protein
MEESNGKGAADQRGWTRIVFGSALIRVYPRQHFYSSFRIQHSAFVF